MQHLALWMCSGHLTPAVEERREGLSCGLDGFACLSYSYCCLNIEFPKCLILKFLSLLMPTYCKHCQGDPLNLNTYLHPLVAKWTPSGSLIVLYFWSGWSFQCQSEGFWEGSGSERQYMFVDATSLEYLYV